MPAKAEVILVSSGNLPWARASSLEAEKEVLEALGLPASAILVEGRSRSTRETRAGRRIGDHRLTLLLRENSGAFAGCTPDCDDHPVHKGQGAGEDVGMPLVIGSKVPG
jgi:hypothetical protein